ncbi:hypothetical protein [Actinomadura violacea]|uniref:Uncharacterized protein n=1 Tax=Actinomadura violacea TaxID=2819934 RepID=A0ABS3S6I5_9ACTN|nr:hypothetical protein [Actinomadura violacea]MBO2464496.1 hypothetical protein [Actinomadura violacea]
MTVNLTTLPPGPRSLDDRSCWAYLFLNSLRETIPAEHDAEQILAKAAEQAEDLHHRIHIAPLDARLEMEFIGSVMAAEVEARRSLESAALEDCQAQYLKQLVAACWAAALNWCVPVEHQR